MIYCPHCDRPLEGHDASHCARRMSRRFFFGLAAGAAVTAAAAPAATKYIEFANGAKIAYGPVREILYTGGYGSGKTTQQIWMVRKAIEQGKRVAVAQPNGRIINGRDWLDKMAGLRPDELPERVVLAAGVFPAIRITAEEPPIQGWSGK